MCGYAHVDTRVWGAIAMSTDDEINMQADVDINPSASVNKAKRASKPKSRPAKADMGKRSINLSLPIEVYERLLIHAMKQTNGNISELVSRLATEHLRDYHIARTATRPSTSE